MSHVHVLPAESLGKDFIPKEFLPKGKNEYYLRNEQSKHSRDKWRHLNSEEVDRLVKNGNTAENWDDILITDAFNPRQVQNTQFYGLVRIGALSHVTLEHHDLRVPSGITNSIIIACDIGDDVAIHDVKYLAHYIIGDRCILMNIHEMHTTNHAKFGNGIVKEGEPEKVRIWLELMNETGSRSVLPFDRMITADAYLWAKYRDDVELQKKLKEMTQSGFDSRRGHYGTVDDECVIKNSRIIKDVKIGSACYIKGANKLKNLTVNSSAEEPTQVGEGCELVNGIIGFGCHIFYGCKAVRFMLGDHSNLKYGARLIHSFLGDNSTISCCEVLNNLIFPAHEQHHNNSFLIASVLLGQSNLAAGATIGSNHNSRANDNEIQAGRGFWPGLCTSVKHSCRFASFTLLSKADYPAEMDIPLPFSLVNNNTSKDQLEVMPAFWWMYNMYALARNSWKFCSRDKRKNKIQNIEYDSLAPDSVEEILQARYLLEVWTAKAFLRHQDRTFEKSDENELAVLGRDLLNGPEEVVNALEVLGEHMEKTRRHVVIIKVYKAYHAYKDMLYYYSVRNLIDYLKNDTNARFSTLCNDLKGERVKSWVNLGGQLMPEKDLDILRADIGSGQLHDWNMIHKRYDALWERYSLEKQKHAFAVFCMLLETEKPSMDQWKKALNHTARILDFVRDQVYLSRKKDYENPFRQATYRNMAEMTAAIGTIEDNLFVRQVNEETEAFKQLVEETKNRS